MEMNIKDFIYRPIKELDEPKMMYISKSYGKNLDKYAIEPHSFQAYVHVWKQPMDLKQKNDDDIVPFHDLNFLLEKTKIKKK